MIQLFGSFIDNFPPEHDCLELSFTPSYRPIKKRWRNNRLSANFLADYFSNFLPFDESNPLYEKRMKDSKAAVSYVANELLENAMKFHEEGSHAKVKFGVHFLEQQDSVIAVIFTTNSVTLGMAEAFQSFIQELLSSDPSELYIQQVERSVETKGGASGLGLLTMLSDYSAKLGWKFEALNDLSDTEFVLVTTMAQIEV